MIIGIDIGGTKTAVRATTAQGELISERQQPTDVARFVPSLKRMIVKASAGKKVTAVGLGIPGMVDPQAGTVMLAINLNILQPLNLVKILSTEFNCPVFIENDVRLATLAVYQKYSVRNLAYMSISTGVSAGIMLNGTLWRGANGMAGEIGHIVLDDDGTLLEDKISGRAIVQAAHMQGLQVSYASEVFKCAEAGDPKAGQIIKQVSNHIARALLWLALGYDIDKIVLGGGVVQNGHTFFSPLKTALAQLRVKSSLNEVLLPDSKIELLPSHFNAGLHGAVGLAAQRLADQQSEFYTNNVNALEANHT